MKNSMNPMNHVNHKNHLNEEGGEPMKYTVNYTTPDGSITWTFESKESATTKANNLYKLATIGQKIATIAISDGYETKRVFIGVDNDTKYAHHVSDTQKSFLNLPQKAEEIRTGRPLCAPWTVSARHEGELVLVQNFMCENEARLRFEELVFTADVEDIVELRYCGALKETTDTLVKKACRLVKINVFKPTTEGMVFLKQIYIGVGPMARKLSELTGKPVEEVLIKVEASVEGLDSKDDTIANEAAKAAGVWRSACLESTFIINDTVFVPFAHGTNAAKDGFVLCCPKGYEEAMRNFMLCGASSNWLRTNAKEAAYAGLQIVATRSYEEINLPLTVADLWISSISVERDIHVGDCIYVNTDGSIMRGERNVHQASSDGSLIMSLSSKKFNTLLDGRSAKVKKNAKKAYDTLVGHSLRMPLVKGYAQVLPMDAAQKFLRSIGINSINRRDIDDIVFFADPTAFKGSFGKNGSHASFEEFVKKFNELHSAADCGRLLDSHGAAPATGTTSAQLWRAMPGMTDEEINTLIDQEMEIINNTSYEQLLGGLLGKLVDNVNELASLPGLQRKLNAARARLVEEAKRGEFHGLVRNYPISVDPFACLAKWAKGIDLTVIPNGIIILRGADRLPGFYEGMEVVIYRSPLTNPGAILVRKLYSSFAAAGIENGEFYDSLTKEDGTVLFSVNDIGLTAMRADVDGDHVAMIINKLFVNTVKRLHNVAGSTPLIDWSAAKAEKTTYTRRGMAEYFASLVRTPNVGVHDNTISKIIGNIKFNRELDAEEFDAIAQCDYRFNNDVDAGKHGATSAEGFNWTETAKWAASQPMPLSVALNKMSKTPGRDVGKVATGVRGSIFDKIRELLDGVEPIREKAYHFGKDELPNVVEKLQLIDAQRAPLLHNFSYKPTWRFFRNGSNIAENVAFIDTEDEIGMQNGETVATAWCIHDDEGRAFAYDENGNELAGEWFINESKSGFFNALRGRYNRELEALNNDPDLRAKASLFKANIAMEARRAVEEYAAIYNCTIRDAFNHVMRVAFKPQAWDRNAGGWSPNAFDLQWICMVFSKEITEIIAANEEDAAIATTDEELHIPELLDF